MLVALEFKVRLFPRLVPSSLPPFPVATLPRCHHPSLFLTSLPFSSTLPHSRSSARRNRASFWSSTCARRPSSETTSSWPSIFSKLCSRRCRFAACAARLSRPPATTSRHAPAGCPAGCVACRVSSPAAAVVVTTLLPQAHRRMATFSTSTIFSPPQTTAMATRFGYTKDEVCGDSAGNEQAPADLDPARCQRSHPLLCPLSR